MTSKDRDVYTPLLLTFRVIVIKTYRGGGKKENKRKELKRAL